MFLERKDKNRDEIHTPGCYLDQTLNGWKNPFERESSLPDVSRRTPQNSGQRDISLSVKNCWWRAGEMPKECAPGYGHAEKAERWRA